MEFRVRWFCLTRKAKSPARFQTVHSASAANPPPWLDSIYEQFPCLRILQRGQQVSIACIRSGIPLGFLMKEGGLAHAWFAEDDDDRTLLDYAERAFNRFFGVRRYLPEAARDEVHGELGESGLSPQRLHCGGNGGCIWLAVAPFAPKITSTAGRLDGRNIQPQARGQQDGVA